MIAFPSNSFGHEAKDSAALAAYFRDSMQVSFPVARPGSVAGAGMQPVYQWLSRRVDNGTQSLAAHDDFEKILIDGRGEIVGKFAASVSPLSAAMQSAMNASY